VADFPPLVYLQRVPELFSCIKLAVNRDRQPGRFLLTGSAQLPLLPHVADALVGRMEPTTLWPFAQQEVDGTGTDFITAAFSDTRTATPGFHFRSRSAGEVDVVLEGPGGTIVGIEVKASDTMQAKDARGLVLYTGDNVLPLRDRLEAAPIATLWS